MLGPWIKANWKWSNRRWQEWISTILGISGLKWTGMGKFNTDDHYIYYCGQESLRRNWVAIIVNKRFQKAVLRCNLKNDQKNLCSFPRQTIQYHGNPSWCPNQKCWRNWSWTVLWRPTRLLELTPKKDVLFIIGDWNAKVGSPEIPGVTGKFGLGVQNKAGQRPIQFCQENALVIANTLFQQHKKRLYTWTSPEGQYQNQMIIFFAAKDGEALYNQQKQDWELTLAQLMKSILPNLDLNWKKSRENH